MEVKLLSYLLLWHPIYELNVWKQNDVSIAGSTNFTKAYKVVILNITVTNAYHHVCY